MTTSCCRRRAEFGAQTTIGRSRFLFLSAQAKREVQTALPPLQKKKKTGTFAKIRIQQSLVESYCRLVREFGFLRGRFSRAPCFRNNLTMHPPTPVGNNIMLVFRFHSSPPTFHWGKRAPNRCLD